MLDQGDPSQTSPSANTSEGSSPEPPGSERSPSETYRAVGAALLAWGVAVGAWGLFQLPGEAGTIELPHGSRTPGSSHAFTTNPEAAAFENLEVRLDAVRGLVSELAALDPATLPELTDIPGLADIHLAPSTVKLLLLRLFQVARSDLQVSPSANVPLGGGNIQQLLLQPDSDQAFNLVDLIVLKAKLQALLLLFLLNPNFGNVDLVALQAKLQALLQLPSTALEQLDLRALNASLNAVFLGNFELSGVKAELDKIDLPVVTTNVVPADVLKSQAAQAIAPAPVNPPIDPTPVSAAQTQAPAPTVTAQYQGNVGLTAPTSELRPSTPEPGPPPPPRPLPPTPTNSQNALDSMTTGNRFEPETMTSPTVHSQPLTTAVPSTTSSTSGSDGDSVSRPTAGADRGGSVPSSGEGRSGGPTPPSGKP